MIVSQTPYSMLYVELDIECKGKEQFFLLMGAILIVIICQAAAFERVEIKRRNVGHSRATPSSSKSDQPIEELRMPARKSTLWQWSSPLGKNTLFLRSFLNGWTHIHIVLLEQNREERIAGSATSSLHSGFRPFLFTWHQKTGLTLLKWASRPEMGVFCRHQKNRFNSFKIGVASWNGSAHKMIYVHLHKLNFFSCWLFFPYLTSCSVTPGLHVLSLSSLSRFEAKGSDYSPLPNRKKPTDVLTPNLRCILLYIANISTVLPACFMLRVYWLVWLVGCGAIKSRRNKGDIKLL